MRKTRFIVLGVLIAASLLLIRTRVYAQVDPNQYPFIDNTNAHVCTIGGVQTYCDYWNFEVRNCTSYAAWRVNLDHGASSSPWFMTNTSLNGVTQGQFSNGGNWDDNATSLGESQGAIVDSVPVPGALAVWNPGEGKSGSVGHVAYVEGVNADGSVNVSEYNWHNDYKYGSRSSLKLGVNDGPSVFVHLNKTNFTSAGGVGGHVKTIGGQNVPFAFVVLTSGNNYYKTFADAGGVYNFPRVPAGSATIRAVDSGNFNKVVIGSINIPANLSANFNIVLSNACVDGSGIVLASVATTQAATSCAMINYPGSGSTSSCPNNSNGLYCGASLGLNTSTLYNCQNGVKSPVQSCTNGCTTQPSGTDDFCTPATSGGASCPNNQNGYYCGSAVGLDPNTLYSCQNGVKTVSQSCALGCIQKPPGTADVCRTSTSGGSCPAGNGDYCGSTLGLDSNTLFSCTSGNISVKQQCSNGCELMPAGTADICYPAGSGGGGTTGDKVVLYGDSNYGANTIRVQAGVGDSEDPSRGSSYKSMSIPGGWSVILSDQHLGLVGNSACFSQSQPNLETLGWATSIESMKVYATNVCPSSPADGVTICRSTGLSNCMTVTQDITSLNNYGFGNDTLKSIQLGGSWEAVLFEDDNYGGRRYVASTNNDLGGIPFGYGSSSIQVRRRDPAAIQLYHLGDFNDGNPFKSDRTITDLSFWDSSTAPDDQKWNDKAQSMRVASGYEVIGCTDAGFHGVCGRTTQDVADLNSLAQGLRNGMSSIQVCQGSCAPTSVPPTLISPANGSSYVPGTPIDLSWAGNGEQYLIEYWGGNFGTNVQSTGWRSGVVAWTVNGLSASTTPYSWHVKSWTSVGDSGWSPTYTFSIQDVSPVLAYINGPSHTALNTDQQFSVLASPSNAANLQYTWSPTPKIGQGTATATYNWAGIGDQSISVTVQNSGGSTSAQFTTNVGCADGKYLAEYFNNKTLSGNPVAYTCEDKIDVDWAYGGPTAISSTAFNLGNGQDGALGVSPGQTVYTDNVRSQVVNSAAANQNTVCLASTAGFSIGDEIMIIQSMGSGAGNYEFDTITSISSCWLTLQNNLANSYTTPNSDVQVLRVPHYTTVSVGGLLTVHPWDGKTGGVMAFRANGGVTLKGGTIDLTGTGYRGGARTYGAAVTGQQGEGLNGTGGATRNPNEPGGGGGGPGTNDGGAGAGGGAYRTGGGTAKDPFYGDPGIGSSSTYGDSILSKLYFGGAGGAGGTDDSGWDGQTFGGRGGNGGGIVYIETNNFTGNGSVLSNGQNGEDHNGVADSEHGGGGGAAGGSIKILADKINADSITLTTNGGAGGKAKDGNAGNGGSGQSYIQYCAKLGANALPGNSLQLVNCDKDNFSVRWTGYINFAHSTTYTFSALADDGIRVFVDGSSTPLIDKWTDGYNNVQATQFLNAGVRPVRVEYYENTGAAQAHLSISEIVSQAPVVSQIPNKTINQGGNFSTINLNSYVTNLAAQTGLTWQATGNNNLQVSIVNNVATVVTPPNWSGSESITFTAKNASNQTASTTVAFTVNGPVVCPAGLFKAEYFNNLTLSGTPVMSRCENAVNDDWGYLSADPLVNIDNFSVRWTTTLHVADSNSRYTFSTDTDDGVRLYIDKSPFIDHWVHQGETTYTTSADLPVGDHVIKMEYFDDGGAAVAKLNWQLNHVPALSQIPGQSITQGENFTDLNLNNYATDQDNEALTWSVSGNTSIQVSITNGVAKLTYPVNWSGSEKLTFAAMDPHGATALGDASFAVVPSLTCTPGEYLAYYYNNMDLSGDPTVSRCETALNHNWGTAAPVVGIAKDNFSARWLYTLNVPVSGVYSFTTKSDEGMRLYVDGLIRIDHWQSHRLMTDTLSLGLTAGAHQIKVDYYDHTSSAAMIMAIALVNKPPVVKPIPAQTIYQGQAFKTIDLSLYGSDPDAGSQITWSASGNNNIAVAIDNNIATLTFPYIWVGTEKITFTATDQYGASASRATTFRVSIISSCPAGQFKAQYYNNMTLSGVAAFTRCESIPQYDWEAASPLPGINADNFSVRWTGVVRFTPTGYYKFITSSDDGIRLYVDNRVLINNWTDHSWTDDQAVKNLSAGNHVIRMEYYENGGGAIAQLHIIGPGHAPVIQAVPEQTINTGQYFPALDLNSYVTDADVGDSFNWGITTNGTLIAGYVAGNQLMVNTPPNWIGTDYITLKVTDSFGLSASVKVTFKSSNVGSCAPGLGNYCVDYFSNPNLVGSPIYSAVELNINHSWGLKAPIASMPVDNFSARWQGNINFRAGAHRFTTTSDNGVRLYVDGQLVIDDWTSHTSKSEVASVTLTAGYHLIQMEYYEATGTAVAKLAIR